MKRALLVGAPLVAINIAFMIFMMQTLDNNAAKRGDEHVLQTNVSINYHDALLQNDKIIYDAIQGVKQDFKSLKQELHNSNLTK